MKRYYFKYKETTTTILTENSKYFKIAVKCILEARNKIERQILIQPEFLTSLEPIKCLGDDELIKDMCYAAKIANVGPMASVAGTIASYAVRRMVEAGAKVAVIDNGGDIAIVSNRPLIVGIYPSDFALIIESDGFYSICTSSGKLGHSISFGHADAATVLAENASIADALATALCNSIKNDTSKNELKVKLDKFYRKYRKFINGAIVIKDNLIGTVGRLPKITKADINLDLITRG